mmetsp:Transcript_894/g.1736  ORF Transcript_894/g.1736 Transcript_894/m.1736 type:complete len:160 (+) Transcript_894:112-591(+)
MKLPQHLQNFIAANGGQTLTIATDNAKTHECNRRAARQKAPIRRHSDQPLRLGAKFHDDFEPTVKAQSQSKGMRPPRRSSDPLGGASRWNCQSLQIDSAPAMKGRASGSEGALPLTQAIRGSSSSNGMLTTDILSRRSSEPAESFSSMLAKLDLGDMEE